MNFFFCLLFLVFSLSGCASFRAAGEVQTGRYALLTGRADLALAHFQRAVETDPDFIYNFTPLQQGLWTYVGRAYYDLGKLSEARQALERARSRTQYDYMAGLYLGLTLARDGDRQRGLKEIETGLRGIYHWLEDITYNTYYGQFWDPLREIRSTIERELALVSSEEVDWKRLMASAEWVGKRMEEEIDLARRDRIRDQERQSEGRNKRRR